MKEVPLQLRFVRPNDVVVLACVEVYAPYFVLIDTPDHRQPKPDSKPRFVVDALLLFRHVCHDEG